MYAGRMNVTVRAVVSPFSFFCITTDNDNTIPKDKLALESSKSDKIDISNAGHGQVRKTVSPIYVILAL